MEQAERMSAKQWLVITAVVILNVIILGALIGVPEVGQRSTPTPTWTPHPTFTPLPHATATAILMPTLAPGETLPLPAPPALSGADRP
jgi:uncharacterized membrane protein